MTAGIITNVDPWPFLEDYLVSMIQAAAQPGGALGIQPNADGTTGIQSIERIVPPVKAKFPNVGVQFFDFDEEAIASHEDQIKIRFIISVTVQLGYNVTSADLGASARAALRPYISDGAGNGLSPLLRANVTLGGMCQRAKITNMESHVLVSDADPADVMATALYIFEVTEPVRVAPTILPISTVPPDLSVSVGSAGGVLGLFRFTPSGLMVNFVDESYADGTQGLITSWSWDFGDSASSALQNPTHAFGSPGTYTVTLTVTTLGGATSVASAPITVS